MSYSLNVLGYGYSKEIEADGPLTDALSKLDAKFSSFDMGSFLHEIGGMKYKEVDGGFYSWMLYRVGPSGNMMPAQEGINAINPRHGEQVYAVYEFFPSPKYKEQELYVLPESPSLPEEPKPAKYQFVSLEEYELPDLWEYREVVNELEEPEVFMPKEYKKQQPEYSLPEFTKPIFTSIETYQVVRPSTTPSRSPVPVWEDNRDLERFLMDLLSAARVDSLLSTKAEEEEPEALVKQV